LYGDAAHLDFWVDSNDYGLVECAHEAILHSVTFPAEKTGFVAGCFDVTHPGYIELFNFAKKHCDYLIVGLHEDATYRPNKLKPVLSIEERFNILNSLEQVNEVVPYKTEEDLLKILSTGGIDVRFLGTDYINDEQRITGGNLNIPIVYHDRSSGWSTTKFKNLIKDSL
jgi:glycerol-3-phosphate cytidylyltransferase